ncbi:MAG: hypothetical protein Q9P01_08815 [Anaerolineae bacterium]|nr:hypothetical protein [Anaerolineae bacterium]
MQIETISYKGWENCYRLSDGTIEVIVTGDVGPRIIHLALSVAKMSLSSFQMILGGLVATHIAFTADIAYGTHLRIDRALMSQIMTPSTTLNWMGFIILYRTPTKKPLGFRSKSLCISKMVLS